MTLLPFATAWHQCHAYPGDALFHRAAPLLGNSGLAAASDWPSNRLPVLFPDLKLVHGGGDPIHPVPRRRGRGRRPLNCA